MQYSLTDIELIVAIAQNVARCVYHLYVFLQIFLGYVVGIVITSKLKGRDEKTSGSEALPV